MDWQAIWDWIWAERAWLGPVLVTVALAVIGQFFGFFRWLIGLGRKPPTTDAESTARLLADKSEELGALKQREKDYQSAIDAMDTDHPGRDFVHGKFERISRRAGSAADIIDQSRNFGRKADDKPQVFVPREAVLWARSLMGEQLRLRDIQVVTRIPDRCRRVSGHDVKFEQVVLNLLTNACDAIELRGSSGGKDDAGFERHIELEISDDTSADTLQLRVRDTGNGIPEDVIGHIFEPFFTTKEVGHGDGLGLSVSYGIVTDMGGALDARNGDEGAEITVSLPAAGGDGEPIRQTRPNCS